MDQMAVGIRAAIRALSDVVEPAVDRSHAQARDQLRLVIEYLEFVFERFDQIGALADFEVRHNLSMATQLREVLADHGLPADSSLVASIDQAARLVLGSVPSAEALRDVAAQLALAVSDLVRVSPTMPPGARRDVERCVLHSTGERIAFERSWYLPLGLDHAPHEVSPLSSLIR